MAEPEERWALLYDEGRRSARLAMPGGWSLELSDFEASKARWYERRALNVPPTDHPDDIRVRHFCSPTVETLVWEYPLPHGGMARIISTREVSNPGEGWTHRLSIGPEVPGWQYKEDGAIEAILLGWIHCRLPHAIATQLFHLGLNAESSDGRESPP
jgi:hypothetical protein